MDLYYTDPAQRLRMAGQDLDDLGRDLSDLSVRRVKSSQIYQVCFNPNPFRKETHVSGDTTY